MDQAELWDDTHVTSMVATVSYSHELQGWRATYYSFERHEGQPDRTLGSGSIEFGPFDSYIEVGYWLAGLSKVLKTMAAGPRHAAPTDSPAGNDDAPHSRGGR